MRKILLSMNLFQRLFLFFMIVVLVPLFLSSLFIYLQASESIEHQVEEYLDQILINTSFQVDEFFEEYELVTLPLVKNDDIQRFLALGKNEEAKRYYIYRKILDQMETMITQNQKLIWFILLGITGEIFCLRSATIHLTIRFPKMKFINS